MGLINKFKKFKSDYKIYKRNIDIDNICNEYRIRNYNINPDGSIDVNGDVDISELALDEIPLKFARVEGYFDCSKNYLTSLEGSPNYVGNGFTCDYRSA